MLCNERCCILKWMAISKEEAKVLLQKEGIPLDKPLVVVSVRNWKDMDKFIKRFA